MSDMKLGMTVNVAPAVIDKDKMLEFAKEYDDVPLHTDEEYAKTTPFGKLEPVQRYCSDTLLTARMKRILSGHTDLHDDNSTRGDIEWIL